MLKFVDLSYFRHKNYGNLSALLKDIGLSLVYLNHLKEHANVLVIQHGLPDEQMERAGIRYKSFPGSDGFFFNPIQAHKLLKQLKPDIVLVQGLIFPVQVWLLRRALGAKAVILVQHHGEQPFINKVKRFCQRIADKAIDGYLFTAKGNGAKWVDAGLISGIDKCHEVLECSTQLTPVDKEGSRRKLGLNGAYNFLWVGRLNKGKDPVTVLNGFERFLSEQPDARLHMIYQTEELLDAVEMKLASNERLQRAVRLVGRVPHQELAEWYSAVDFFISGSHHEAAGFALLEAMACGCIPVVTNIPSFAKLTDGGKYGFLFEPGNAGSLSRTLRSIRGDDRQELPKRIMHYFEKQLSFEKISVDIYDIAIELIRKKR